MVFDYVDAAAEIERSLIALGATAVFIGPAYLYGLMARGTTGGIHALTLLHDELLRTLQLLGVTDIASLDRSYVGLGSR